MEARCSVCKRIADPRSPAYPFCSRRCKMLDLGRWLDGSYCISRAPADDDLDAPSLPREAGGPAKHGASD